MCLDTNVAYKSRISKKSAVEVSGLIFSADSIFMTLLAAEHLHQFCQEVVVIYSLSHKDFEKLKKTAPAWIKVYYTIRLSYPEMYRHYGIDKCSGRWIILLDVDERFFICRPGLIPMLLKKDISALLVKRMESSSFFTWQVRIFRKGYAIWKGNTHESPKIRGKAERADPEDLTMFHYTEHGRRPYAKFEEEFPTQMPIVRTMKDMYVAWRIDGKYLGFWKTYAFRKLPYMKNKAICDEIREKGVTRILGLENNETVEKLNKKYGSCPQGADLLIRLLKDVVVD